MSISPVTYLLGDYITMYGGGTPSKDNAEYWNGNIPWASVKDLTSSRLRVTQDSITTLGVANSSTKVAKPGSIIIATRMAVGRVTISEVDVAINQDLKVIECSAGINTQYLYYFLISKENYFLKVASGATVKGIKINHILDLNIPLPGLEEQTRIAEILEAADSLRQKDQQLIDHYTALSQSLFLDMFGDPSINPMGWDIHSFEYFASIDTKMTKDFELYSELPHIGIANIEKDTGRLFGYNKVKDDNLTSGKYLFTKEHIIFSKIRPNLNKVALPNFGGLVSADSYPILVNTDRTNRIFFAYILRSSSFLDFISKHSSRSNIPKANKSQLMQFEAIAPPVTLQNKFAEMIELIENQNQKAQANLEQSKDLFNSLLQQAFNGELTGNKVKAA